MCKVFLSYAHLAMELDSVLVWSGEQADTEPITVVSVAIRRVVRSAALWTGMLLVVTGFIALVLLSPLILRQLGSFNGVEWANLSNVGQTYGAASAILSAVALLGVSLSLLVQARQAYTERIKITRERHMEMLKIILEEPDTYHPVTTTTRQSEVEARRAIFSNMWMNYARIGFGVGVLSEDDVRNDIMRPAFKSAPMREHWAGARRYWKGRYIEDRRERLFVKIVDDEYLKALASGPPRVPDVEGNSRIPINGHVAGGRTGAAAGALAGICIGIIVGSRCWEKMRN